MKQFRLCNVGSPHLEVCRFARDPDIDLSRHAPRALGSFHDDDEQCEIVWRINPASEAQI